VGKTSSAHPIRALDPLQGNRSHAAPPPQYHSRLLDITPSPGRLAAAFQSRRQLLPHLCAPGSLCVGEQNQPSYCAHLQNLAHAYPCRPSTSFLRFLRSAAIPFVNGPKRFLSLSLLLARNPSSGTLNLDRENSHLSLCRFLALSLRLSRVLPCDYFLLKVLSSLASWRFGSFRSRTRYSP